MVSGSITSLIEDGVFVVVPRLETLLQNSWRAIGVSPAMAIKPLMMTH